MFCTLGQNKCLNTKNCNVSTEGDIRTVCMKYGRIFSMNLLTVTVKDLH